MIKTLMGSIRDYIKVTVATPLLVLGEVLCEMLIPFITANLIDAIKDGTTVAEMLPTAGFLVLIALTSLAFGAAAGVTCSHASCGFAKNLRHDLFYKIQTFSFANIDEFSSSSLVTRLTTDINNVQQAFMMIIRIAVRAPLVLIFAFTMAFIMGGSVAMVYLVIIPLLGFGLFFIIFKVRPIFSRVFHKYDALNESVEENVTGMRVVKSFANEETERFKFRASNNRYLSSKENMYHAMGVYTATYGLLSGVLYVIVVLLGGWLVAQGQLQAVDMATFALYISLFCTPLETLVNSAETYQKAIAGFKRMDEVLSTAPDIQDKPGATDLQVTAGAVEYHDVCFNYEDVELGEGYADERPVIDHMDLSIKPGQTIALVGPSGGGKSTTCSLLPRFYDVATGSISIDGQDVRDVTQQSLRRAIGLVQQDVYLFDGTIGENIAYGKPGATAEEISEAARRANIDTFIESLPQGYDTVVGERGSRLSGGQKQRVAIARVFLKNPKILILDEATSALDNESEEAVQESLEELARGRTTIIIAHRLSTIKHADEIATVEHGRVVERGTHEELLARGGTYARYYRMQFEGARAHELD